MCNFIPCVNLCNHHHHQGVDLLHHRLLDASSLPLWPFPESIGQGLESLKRPAIFKIMMNLLTYVNNLCGYLQSTYSLVDCLEDRKVWVEFITYIP